MYIVTRRASGEIVDAFLTIESAERSLETLKIQAVEGTAELVGNQRVWTEINGRVLSRDHLFQRGEKWVRLGYDQRPNIYLVPANDLGAIEALTRHLNKNRDDFYAITGYDTGVDQVLKDVLNRANIARVNVQMRNSERAAEVLGQLSDMLEGLCDSA